MGVRIESEQVTSDLKGCRSTGVAATTRQWEPDQHKEELLNSRVRGSATINGTLYPLVVGTMN
jgi:hypothetical protein